MINIAIIPVLPLFAIFCLYIYWICGNVCPWKFSPICLIYTSRFLACVRACVRSKKFNRKRFNLHKTLRFLWTEEAGHSIGESANRAAGALTSDEDGAFVELHGGKETVSDWKTDLPLTAGWLRHTTAWASRLYGSALPERGDPVLSVLCRKLPRVKCKQVIKLSDLTSNERSFFSALQQLDALSVSLPTEQQ